ncbi:hypothetical protein DLM78_02680 [Leptospira stimsonii]|uniref:Uncharacterized protein n=1 Tax=Leptospira stimsonii TaxID=2202203 RepID=A0A8B3CUF5_9LEPT|nr:hypothetical protein DLM78_02680 [Leptospira stimsonii]
MIDDLVFSVIRSEIFFYFPFPILCAHFGLEGFLHSTNLSKAFTLYLDNSLNRKNKLDSDRVVVSRIRVLVHILKSIP